MRVGEKRTSSRRTRRDAGEVRRWLARRAREGWTWPELVRRSGIPRTTLQSWQRRLSKGDDAPRFVAHPLPSPPIKADLPGPRPRAQCLIELPTGHRLTVEEGFSAEGLRDLVAALELR